jgi:hypothetical protein
MREPMIVLKKALNRRMFVRGLGTMIGLPLLDSMIPAMAATGLRKPPTRLGFVYTPNGIIQKDWVPKSQFANFEFQASMKALEPFREKLLVLSNLSQANADGMGDGAGEHARAGATWLTGVHPKKTQGLDVHAGVSADQVAAKELGKFTQFASLEIGLEEPYFAGTCDGGYSCAYTNTISWRSPTTPNPVEISPRAVFERLFGDGGTTSPAARNKQIQQDRTILDYVSADLARLKPGLGPRDKSKLDEYFDSIRDIERRIQKAEQQRSNVALPVMERPAGIPDTFEEHARLMSDLMVVAWQADLTRVISFMMARESSNRSYREIGVSDGHHAVTHHQGDPDKIAKAQKIDELHVRSFAYLVKRLQDTKDGDGTLLDHSLLLYGSGIRDGNIHDHHDLPLALVGGKSVGIKGGRHIRYKQETPMNNLLLALLDKANVPVERLGDSTGKLDKLCDI